LHGRHTPSNPFRSAGAPMELRSVDPMECLRTLQGTMAVDGGEREAAERALAAMASQPAFASTLADLCVQGGSVLAADEHVRQLAGVVLKKHVQRHWSGEEGQGAVEIGEEERAAVRHCLLNGLADQSSKVRTSVGMAIAAIARCDWPEKWPNLLDVVVGMLNGQGGHHPAGTSGAVQCLSLFADDIGEEFLPSFIASVFPALLTMALPSDGQHGGKAIGDNERAQALGVIRSCISSLSMMSSQFKSETRACLKPWLAHLSHLLGSVIATRGSADSAAAVWTMKLGALKILMALTTNFASVAKGVVTHSMTAFWDYLELASALWDAQCVRGSEGFAEDENGEGPFENAVYQAFELISSLFFSKALGGIVMENIERFAYLCSGPFIQVSSELAETWLDDPNKFLCNEEDDSLNVEVRNAARDVLFEISESLESASSARASKICVAFLGAIGKRLEEAEAWKQAGDVEAWWRYREGALHTMSQLSNILSKHVQNAKLAQPLDIKGLLHYLIGDLCQGDATGAHLHPILHSKYFDCISAFMRSDDEDEAPAVLGEAQHRAMFFRAAALVVSNYAGASPFVFPVRMAAAKSLVHVLEGAEDTQQEFFSLLDESLQNIIMGVTHMISETSEDTAQLVFECLSVILNEVKSSAMKGITSLSAKIQALEPVLAPAILAMWVRYSNDPLISLEAIDAIESLAKVPGCSGPVRSRAIPEIKRILEQACLSPTGNPDPIVGGSIDLLSALVRPSSSKSGGDSSDYRDGIKACCDACYIPLIRFVCTTDDNEAIQNGTECLICFIKAAGPEFATWSCSGSSCLELALELLQRLLSATSTDSASMFVGTLIQTLLAQVPSEVMARAQILVRMVLSRLAGARMPTLIQALLVVVARLALIDAQALVALLVAEEVQVSGEATGPQVKNGLDFVMEVWTEQQSDIMGAYNTRLTLCALVSILSTCSPRFASLAVKGEVVSGGDTGGVIMTRSKRKEKGREEREVVPVLRRVLYLLAAACIDEHEGQADMTRRKSRNDEDDNDGGWVEASDDDGEGASDDDDDWEDDGGRDVLSGLFNPGILNLEGEEVDPREELEGQDAVLGGKSIAELTKELVVGQLAPAVGLDAVSAELGALPPTHGEKLRAVCM